MALRPRAMNASIPSSYPLPKTAKRARVSRRAEREGEKLGPEIAGFAQRESTELLRSDIVNTAVIGRGTDDGIEQRLWAVR